MKIAGAASLLLLAACGSSVAPGALEPAPPSAPAPPLATPAQPIAEPELAKALRGLRRSSNWTLVQTIPLGFDIHHVQGMVKLGDRFHFTAEDEAGQAGHLFTTDLTGKLLRDVTLTEGARIHPGGLDTDGQFLYTALAEHAAKTSSRFLKIEPATGAVTKLFEFKDHVSFALRVGALDQFIGDDYDNAVLRRFSGDGRLLETLPNPSRMVALQDCKSLSFPYAYCTGLRTLSTDSLPTVIQAITLRDVRTMAVLHEVPFALYLDQTTPALTNPSFLELAGDKLRLYVAPKDDTSGAVSVYETPVAAVTPDKYPYFTTRGDYPLLPSDYTGTLPPLKGLAAAFVKVNHDTDWVEKARTPLRFVVQHAQGILKIGDLFYLTDVDRTREQGYLHTFTADGTLVRTVTVATAPDYHPGGLDYDGESLWVPVAAYTADSTGQVLRVDPTTLQVREKFAEPVDHLGAIARDRVTGLLTGMTWGSRRLRTYTPEGKLVAVRPNPTHMGDWQDCKSLPDGYALCSGVIDHAQPGGPGGLVTGAASLGALALVHLASNTIVHMFPWPHHNQQQRASTQNTFFAELDGKVIRLYFASDDQVGNLFVYEAVVPD